MLCFRQAIRAAPRPGDATPRSGRSAAAWATPGRRSRVAQALAARAGAPRPAAGAGRSAARRGDAGAARDAAARAVALAPDQRRPLALDAIARLTRTPAPVRRGDTGALAAIAAVLEREPTLLATPASPARSRRALDAAHDADRGRAARRSSRGRRRSRRGAGAAAGAGVEHAATVGPPQPPRRARARRRATRIRARRARCTAPDRARGDSAQAAEAAAPARALRRAVRRVRSRRPVPLPWPRRCAGERLRVVALVGTGGDARSRTPSRRWRRCREASFDVALAPSVRRRDAPAGGVIPQRAVAGALAVPGDAGRRRGGSRRRDPDVAGGSRRGSRPPSGRCSRSVPRATRRRRSDARADGVAAAGRSRASPIAGDSSPALRRTRARTLPPRAGCPIPRRWTRCGSRRRAGAPARRPRRGARGYDRVLELQPGFAPAHHLRGVLARDDGDWPPRARDFAAALPSRPAYVDARVAAAHAALDAHDAGGRGRAVRGRARPRPATPWRCCARWGLAAAGRGTTARRAAHCSSARWRSTRPTAETHYNHGVALQMQRGAADAARAYQRALALQPDLAAAEFNLGVLFQEQGATDAAIAAYAAVLRADPRHVAAYKNLGEVLFAAGPARRVVRQFPQRFEANCPDALRARGAGARGAASTAATSRRSTAISTACGASTTAPATRSSCATASSSCSTCCCSSTSSRSLSSASRRPTTRRRSMSRRAAAARRGAPARADPRRLPVGRPAQPRDGQDDVAGDPASRPRAVRAASSIRCRASATSGPTRFRGIADRFEVVARPVASAPRRSASPPTTSTSSSTCRRTPRARSRASSR